MNLHMAAVPWSASAAGNLHVVRVVRRHIRNRREDGITCVHVHCRALVVVEVAPLEVLNPGADNRSSEANRRPAFIPSVPDLPLEPYPLHDRLQNVRGWGRFDATACNITAHASAPWEHDRAWPPHTARKRVMHRSVLGSMAPPWWHSC